MTLVHSIFVKPVPCNMYTVHTLFAFPYPHVFFLSFSSYSSIPYIYLTTSSNLSHLHLFLSFPPSHQFQPGSPSLTPPPPSAAESTTLHLCFFYYGEGWQRVEHVHTNHVLITQPLCSHVGIYSLV